MRYDKDMMIGIQTRVGLNLMRRQKHRDGFDLWQETTIVMLVWTPNRGEARAWNTARINTGLKKPVWIAVCV